MEGRGAVCTRWTGAVALRGSERAKGGREQREWGSNCAHKVLGLLANSQTYTLGSIPLSNVDSSSFRRNRKISILWRASLSNLDRTDLCLIDKNQIHNLRWSFFFFLFHGKSKCEIRFRFLFLFYLIGDGIWNFVLVLMIYSIGLGNVLWKIVY